MTTALTPEILRELGRTGGGPAALGVLTAGQRTRRLLLLRTLLDAVAAAPAGALPPGAAESVRHHWGLLEEAERAAPAAARRVLYYPFVGAWAETCVRALATAAHRPAGPGPRPPAPDLAHLGHLACAAAVRAGIDFRLRLPARDGTLPLPTVGALCRTEPGPPPVEFDVRGERGRLTVRPVAAPPAQPRTAEVRRSADGTWRSADPRWAPVHTLPAGPWTVLLDDLDPYRSTRSGRPDALRAAERLPDGERNRWRSVWQAALPLLRLGGEPRATEAETLLDCVVPLDPPPGASPYGGAAHCSGTRREAYGAVLSSAPPGPGHLAATVVHELQHAKLSALAELVPLHTAGPTPLHWAPWRVDPRPFDGLLQGAYSHLALADYWQRLALATDDPMRRDSAWAEHSRCREQVGATLPTLLGSRRLTPEGRVLVGEMAAHQH
ncbi:HEXXH motif domain-containing protein, partial [Streptomyces sp. URMC 123]|uniref:HEXXH motif domain-containing protein n=1 Tax=Streptomyces sp. URMC 123 TaxID=3423403 RepID=UPI003F1A54EF